MSDEINEQEDGYEPLPEDLVDDSQDDGYHSFYDDEYDDDEWEYDDEPEESSFDLYLCKAKNGQLYAVQVFGYRYRHQDWGEAYFDEERLSMRECRKDFVQWAIANSRDMKPGDWRDVTMWPSDIEPEDTDDTDYSDIPF
jgi:hypothetical protein